MPTPRGGSQGNPGSELYGGQNLTPVPDPTVLTGAAILREIANLKEVIFARLDGMDRAITLHNEAAAQIRSESVNQVKHLQELLLQKFEVHEEKFQSVQTQFQERDTRTEQTQKDTKTAVDAALQAAKEAVDQQNKSNALAIAKSEAATTKQIDQMTALMANAAKTSDDKNSDLKERVTAMEGRSAGHGQLGSVIFAVIGAVVGIVTGGVAVLGFATRH